MCLFADYYYVNRIDEIMLVPHYLTGCLKIIVYNKKVKIISVLELTEISRITIATFEDWFTVTYMGYQIIRIYRRINFLKNRISV